MNRNKGYAIFGALVLTMSIAGVALAADLLAGQVGIKLSEKDAAGSSTCLNFPLEIGEGEIGVHFVLSQPDADSGTLDAVFSTDSFSGVDSSGNGGGTLQWYAVITGDGDTTITSAHTDVTGGNLVLSHTCSTGGETSPPETAPPTAPPSFEQSQEGETDAPTGTPDVSFSQSQEGETDAPTEPSTDAFGGSGTSAPADGAWLLVVALGVLLASVVVLTPARAKSRR
jgi:hypothetical protein